MGQDLGPGGYCNVKENILLNKMLTSKLSVVRHLTKQTEGGGASHKQTEGIEERNTRANQRGGKIFDKGLACSYLTV